DRPVPITWGDAPGYGEYRLWRMKTKQPIVHRVNPLTLLANGQTQHSQGQRPWRVGGHRLRNAF
ncbi:MAG: hypothetical protein ACK480_18550, partial [Planctomycetota bacterium]